MAHKKCKAVTEEMVLQHLRAEFDPEIGRYRHGADDEGLFGWCSGCNEFYKERAWDRDGITKCCDAPLHPGNKVLIKKSEHFACQDHKDGKIFVGDTYEVRVYSCWKEPLDYYGSGSFKWKYEEKRLIRGGQKRRILAEKKQEEVNELLAKLKAHSTMMPTTEAALDEAHSSQTTCI